MCCDILNRLAVDHECDRQMDDRTDRSPLAKALFNDPCYNRYMSGTIMTFKLTLFNSILLQSYSPQEEQQWDNYH